jgi:DNA-binding PucR family transcriptional regulator
MDIRDIFPDAILADAPRFRAGYASFFDPASGRYIHIPEKSLTDRERKLLSAFLTPADAAEKNRLNSTPEQERWHRYLLGGGPLPDGEERRIRFLHFFIQQPIKQQEFIDALQSFLQEGMVVVWLDENNGIIVERESAEPVAEEEWQSFIEAIQSDFYFDVYFYRGRFFPADEGLKDRFRREQAYFHTALKKIQNERLFNFERAFPVFLLLSDEETARNFLAEEWQELFAGDYELLSMIKLFIENNSNISSTAKMLYLHRNSLQYRIDKFIERTSVDIKTFHGSVSVYFICLFGEIVRKGDGFPLGG